MPLGSSHGTPQVRPTLDPWGTAQHSCGKGEWIKTYCRNKILILTKIADLGSGKVLILLLPAVPEPRSWRTRAMSSAG